MTFDKVVPTNNKHKWVNTCEYIVLHHTGWGEYNGLVTRLSASTWKDAVSCHYLVAQDGRVAKIWWDTDILRHAWSSARDGKTNMNRYCIGIEIINVGMNFTNVQRKAVRDLVSYLIEKHSIPVSKIIRHKDISPGRKVDVYDTLRNPNFKTFQEYQRSFLPKK